MPCLDQQVITRALILYGSISCAHANLVIKRASKGSVEVTGVILKETSKDNKWSHNINDEPSATPELIRRRNFTRVLAKTDEPIVA